MAAIERKNNKGSDLSGTTGTVDDEEEEEFAPDYSEECERLQLEVKSLSDLKRRERTKPLSGPGAEFKEQANAFNAHLKKVVRDLEATRSLNAQLTRRLEIRRSSCTGIEAEANLIRRQRDETYESCKSTYDGYANNVRDAS